MKQIASSRAKQNATLKAIYITTKERVGVVTKPRRTATANFILFKLFMTNCKKSVLSYFIIANTNK